VALPLAGVQQSLLTQARLWSVSCCTRCVASRAPCLAPCSGYGGLTPAQPVHDGADARWQVAFWDHSSTLSAAVMGLYTVPKVRGLRASKHACCQAPQTQGRGWGLPRVIFVEQPAQQR